MATIAPKGWDTFQHYKDRKPAWIKLHRDLLDNYDFHCLPVASKALAPCLWLLASEYEGGQIPADWRMIAFRLRMTAEDVEKAVTPLIQSGFFIASNPLADCKQSACLEKERETEKETEGEQAAQQPEAPARKKREAMTLVDWLTALDGKQAIRDDDPILAELDDIGVPQEYALIAWHMFKTKFADGKQKDWPAHFRNAIRGNWLKTWYFDSAGACQLTTAGEQARRAMEAKQ